MQINGDLLAGTIIVVLGGCGLAVVILVLARQEKQRRRQEGLNPITRPTRPHRRDDRLEGSE